MSRYRFSLHPRVKGYIEWRLEHYKEDRKQLEEYRDSLIPSGVQSYSSGGVQSGIGSPTEQAAIKLATDAYILSMERSVRAIESVLGKCDETDLKLIELVYWRRLYNIEGAGMKVHVSRRTAYRRINKILCLMALEMGLTNI